MPDDNYWLVAFEKLLALLGFVAAGSFAWLLNRYRQDRQMLLQHQQLLASHDEELKLLKQMRTNTNGGSRPMVMITGLQEALDKLAGDMSNWQAINEKLNMRDDNLHEEVVKVRESQAAIFEALKWIKEHINSHK